MQNHWETLVKPLFLRLRWRHSHCGHRPPQMVSLPDHSFPKSFKKHWKMKQNHNFREAGKDIITFWSCLIHGRPRRIPRRTPKNHWKTKGSPIALTYSCGGLQKPIRGTIQKDMINLNPSKILEIRQNQHFSKAGEVIIYWGTCRRLVDQPRSST